MVDTKRQVDVTCSGVNSTTVQPRCDVSRSCSSALLLSKASRIILGDAVGVEIGTPGVTSPGMEAYLPAPPEMMREALLNSSAELHDLDTSRRGWTVVEFTPEQVTSTWRFVSTILESQYSVVESTPIVCKAGDRSFS